MKKIQYALFDMDGTMLESQHYWNNIVAEWAGGRAEAPEGLGKKLEALSIAQGLSYVQESYAGTPLGEITWQSLFDLMGKHYREDVYIKPGVTLFLDHLQERGIRMGILTGTPRELADLALESTGLSRYFAFSLTPDECPGGKKETEIFEEGLRRLGDDATVENTLFFEDALYSIQTAKEMGFYTIGLEDATNAKEEDEIRALCDEYWEKMEIRGICQNM